MSSGIVNAIHSFQELLMIFFISTCSPSETFNFSVQVSAINEKTVMIQIIQKESLKKVYFKHLFYSEYSIFVDSVILQGNLTTVLERTT